MSAEGFRFQNVEVEAYEIDNTLRAHLETTLAGYAERSPVTYRVSPGDFIWEAACQSWEGSAAVHPRDSESPLQKDQ